MNYYPHHIGDFIRDTARLGDSQCMAYLRLIWLYYESEQPLTGDVEQLAFQIGSDEKTVAMLLKCFFYANAERWHHKRIDSEIEAYKSKSLKASESAKSRWKNAKTVQSECEPMRTHNEGNTNQEPITNNKDIGTNVPIVASKLDDCPHDKILQLFAKQCPQLTQPKAWGKDRQTNLRARWRFLLTAKRTNGEPFATSPDDALEFFSRMFAYVARNDFLSGRNNRGWECTLPWLIEQKNFIKVVEGNYDMTPSERSVA